MPDLPLEPERLRELNCPEHDYVAGKYVLYWCSEAPRIEENPALAYAIHRANQLDQSVLVVFGLWADFPEATARTFHFLLQGLADFQVNLETLGLKFLPVYGRPSEVALRLAKDASLLVCDAAYLQEQRRWREEVADQAPCPVWQVETEVIVPVELASPKAEYGAYTIRPKLHKLFSRFCQKHTTPKPKKKSLDLEVKEKSVVDLSNLDGVLEKLKCDQSVQPVPMFSGGETEARRVWREFLAQKFNQYDGNRNQPQTSDVSHMSKYLHYGHISPVTLAVEAREAASGGKEDKDSFIEELFVRRELAFNFTYYTPDYDSLTCLPDWAQATIADHAGDSRTHLYTREQLDNAETHDPYWNAAMREMKFTGYMHNYMRMYWGKKIIEWSASAEEAWDTTLYLNNRYFLDGRDPNSYAGVAWCYGKHDRPWTERAVFGKLRYMNAAGLERKAKPKLYVEKVDRLVDEALGAALL